MKMSDRYGIAVLEGEDAKAFLEYDQRPPTQEEIDCLEESLASYRRHESRKGDEMIKIFYKL